MAALFKDVLLLVDGTESSVRAAQFAIRCAECTGAKLTAVTVVDTECLRKLMSARILVDREVADLETELEKNQMRHLNYFARQAEKAGISAQTCLRKGVCHSEVLALQKELDAGLIVIGAFRLRLTKLDLVASERQLILDESPCPVLIVK